MSKVLISEKQIKKALKKYGKILTEEYKGKPLLLVSILSGAFVFMADLCREIKLPVEISFMKVSSYFEGTVSTGEVQINLDLNRDIKDYDVLIVEDIIDTGRTLYKIIDVLKQRGPKSIKVITLLDKPERRLVDFKADYALFTIPDKFIVGYGLDYAEKYRNLKNIEIVENV